MPGKLITFEGIDGCGKTTALRHLCLFLEERGIPFILPRQPGGTAIGEEIRQILLFKTEAKLSPYTEMLLFLASFRQSLDEVILPALESGTWVICDRYTDSTRAYQGGGRNIGVEKIHSILRQTIETREEFIPDATLLFDLPARAAAARTNHRAANLEGPESSSDRFESEGIKFQELIRQTYLQIAAKEPERFHLIDTNKLGQEEAAQAAIQIIAPFLDQKENPASNTNPVT